jgi:hypothetical protein
MLIVLCGNWHGDSLSGSGFMRDVVTYRKEISRLLGLGILAILSLLLILKFLPCFAFPFVVH